MTSQGISLVIWVLFLVTASPIIAQHDQYPKYIITLEGNNCNATLFLLNEKPHDTVQGLLHRVPYPNPPPSWIALIDCGPTTDTAILAAQNGNALGAVLLNSTSKVCNQKIASTIPIFETYESTCFDNITESSLEAIIGHGEKFNQGGSPPATNNNTTELGTSGQKPVQTYKTAMIVLYAVSGIVLGLFFIVVVTNIIKNRIRDSSQPIISTDPNNRNQRGGIGKALLDSFPVYLFSLGGVSTPGLEGINKDLKDDLEKGKFEDGCIEMEAITDPKKIILTGEPQPINTVVRLSDNLPPKLPDSIVCQLQKSQAYSRSTSVISSNHVTEEQLTCPICLGDFESGEELRILPCHHQYHTSCIDPWLLDISPLCPMCKADCTTWSMDISTIRASEDFSMHPLSETSLADPAQNDTVDSDDALSQASSDSPQIFPHFRWIKYLRAIRLSRRRRRSRRPTARHSIQPIVNQPSGALPIETTTHASEVRDRDLRLYRASM